MRHFGAWKLKRNASVEIKRLETAAWLFFGWVSCRVCDLDMMCAHPMHLVIWFEPISDRTYITA